MLSGQLVVCDLYAVPIENQQLLLFCDMKRKALFSIGGRYGVETALVADQTIPAALAMGDDIGVVVWLS